MNNMNLQELNAAVQARQIGIKSIDRVNTASLEELHNSIFKVSEEDKIIHRCEACRHIKNPRVVEARYRERDIKTITEACEQLWGPAYVPVNFSHDLEGNLLRADQMELMLIGFAPGGATRESRGSDIDLLDIHSVALGLKWAEYGKSGAQRNRSNIGYILNLVNEGIGENDYFKIGRNVHLTNIFKCRSHCNKISPFRQEAQLCYERHLRNETALLPNLKAIIMFMQEQNFPPLIRRSDVYGTFRYQEGKPLYAYMWHFANPGFNIQRSLGKFDDFCPKLGKEIRERFLDL